MWSEWGQNVYLTQAGVCSKVVMRILAAAKADPLLPCLRGKVKHMCVSQVESRLLTDFLLVSVQCPLTAKGACLHHIYPRSLVPNL